ncbi:hypothetical protein BGZ94_007507, partial [Podila epigama]
MSKKASEVVLQTPELLFRIGWFMPLWKHNRIQPKNLVSCIKVCRFWRDVLTPLLWMVYDDTHDCIPAEIIHANREHIRYLDHSASSGQSLPQVTQLKGLYLKLLSTDLPQHVALLEANPGLRSLHLRQISDGPEFSPSLFKPLTALQYLCLIGRDNGLSSSILKSILDSNQRLESLSLEFISALDPDFNDWGVYPGMKKVRFRDTTSTFHCYFRLLQGCTNLEMLVMNESWMDPYDRRPRYALLSRILQEYCRKVKVLWYHQLYENIPDNVLSTRDCLNVIQATSNLVQLRLAMNSFSAVICDTLLHGSAHSIEALFLDIESKSSGPESFVSAGRVLSSCPKLQHLHLSFEYYPKCSVDLEKPLFAQPWVCNNLKTITLKPMIVDSSYYESYSEYNNTPEEA